MSDRIGQQLGNYRLTQLLGQGGFADVYLGEHLYLNTKAAIKVLQTRLSNEAMADFQNEARTIANLVHPHIVRVLDFGVDNATPYLVMDYALNGTLRQFFPKAVPLSPRIASAGNDNTVHVWNAATGQTIVTYTGHTAAVHQVVWSPDGSRIVSASEDKTAQVWNANTGQTYVTYTRHTDKVLTLAWSHNGTYIATGSWDATTQVWDASAGSWLLTYTGHSQRIWSVAWSPDDTKIVSGSHDGTAQIWSSSTAGRIYTYTGHGSGNTVWQALWSPNGQMIASVGYDSTAQVWQAE